MQMVLAGNTIATPELSPFEASELFTSTERSGQSTRWCRSQSGQECYHRAAWRDAL